MLQQTNHDTGIAGFKTIAYEALHKFYLLGPKPEVLDKLKHLSENVQDSGNITFLDKGLTLLIDFFSNPEPFDSKSLEVEYTSLLVGPGYTIVTPYESYYASKEKTPENRPSLMGQPAINARKKYIEEGLIMEKYLSYPEDHIGTELEFMYYLCSQAMNALISENDEQFQSFIAKQKAFLNDHLLNWYEEFCSQLADKGSSDLVIGVAKLTQGLLDLEKELMLIEETQ